MNTNTNDTPQPASATRPDCAPPIGSAVGDGPADKWRCECGQRYDGGTTGYVFGPCFRCGSRDITPETHHEFGNQVGVSFWGGDEEIEQVEREIREHNMRVFQNQGRRRPRSA